MPVLTDAGGSAESICGGETGLLCTMDDHKGLVDGVVRLLRNKETRSSLARAGRAFVAQRFNPDTIHAPRCRFMKRWATAQSRPCGGWLEVFSSPHASFERAGRAGLHTNPRRA